MSKQFTLKRPAFTLKRPFRQDLYYDRLDLAIDAGRYLFRLPDFCVTDSETGTVLHSERPCDTYWSDLMGHCVKGAGHKGGCSVDDDLEGSLD